MCLIKIRWLPSFDLCSALPADPLLGIPRAHVTQTLCPWAVPVLGHLSRWRSSHLNEWGVSPAKARPAAKRPPSVVVAHLVGRSAATRLTTLVFTWPLSHSGWRAPKCQGARERCLRAALLSFGCRPGLHGCHHCLQGEKLNFTSRREELLE